jgi:hypothetical protein
VRAARALQFPGSLKVDQRGLRAAAQAASALAEVKVREAQTIRRKLRELSPSSIGWLVAVAIVLSSSPSIAADGELDSLEAYWRAQAPWCSFQDPGESAAGVPLSKEFASKNEDGVDANTPPCNDGDSVMFNALLCLAGVELGPGEGKGAAGKEAAAREVGCNVVKDSQSLAERSANYGRWWRSPRRRYLASLNQQPDGGSESTFSNDHALGVMVYLAQTKNIGAFQAWMNWLKNKGGVCTSLSCIPGMPRYCEDDRCGFKAADCLLLDQLARYLGVENTVCGSDSVKVAQSAAWHVVDGLVVVLKLFLPELNDFLDKYGAGEQGARSIERLILINSIINDEGFPLHDIAVTVYLLRKFGSANAVETQLAANIAHERANEENAFFEFVAYGPTTAVNRKIVQTCPSKQNDVPHAKFQWIWERQDISETAKKTMYWDCLFIAAAFMKGDYPSPTAAPGLNKLAYHIAQVRKKFDFRHLQH